MSHPVNDLPAIDRVNVYRSEGVWCYAAWSGRDFDHSSTLSVPDGASVAEAIAEAGMQFPRASIAKVDDV